MNNEEYFVRSILKWTEHELLDYPWRKFNDPYKV